jgi:hypothetical protein
MGKMTIHVDAKVEGKSTEFTFNWEGDDPEIKNVMEFIEQRADEANITPETFTHSTLRELPATGLLKEPGAQQVQMMAILYTVLQMPTRSPDRPGSIYNYAASENIDATLIVGDKGVSGHIEGRHLGH